MLFLLILLHWFDPGPKANQHYVSFPSSMVYAGNPGDAGVKGGGGYVYFRDSVIVIYLAQLKKPPMVYRAGKTDTWTADATGIHFEHFRPGESAATDNRPTLEVGISIDKNVEGGFSFTGHSAYAVQVEFKHGSTSTAPYAKMEAIIKSAIAKHQVH